MKHIYTSPLCGWDESANRVFVYELENDEEICSADDAAVRADEEIWDFREMTFEEKCDLFNVYEEPDYSVAPGAMYHRYNFDLTGTHVIMTETIALNV